MRARHFINEASLPFGKSVNTSGYTFGFEAEFLVNEHWGEDEVDWSSISDLGELRAHFDYWDEDDESHLFTTWQDEDEDRADANHDDWFDDVGAEEIAAGMNATNHRAWGDVMDAVGEYVGEHILGDHIQVAGYQQPFEKKNANSWYLEGDASVRGSEDQYDAEITSPVFHGYAEFESCFDAIMTFIGEDSQVTTNSSCGLHINIGPPEHLLAKLDRVKLLAFAGEEWLGKVWARSRQNEHIQALLPQLAERIGFERNMDALIAAMDEEIDGLDDKHFAINLMRLPTDRYIEFRATGGAGYEKRITEVKHHIMRYIALLDVAASPERFRQEYAKKLWTLVSGGAAAPAQSLPIRQITKWLGGMNLRQSDRDRVIKNGKIVIDLKMLIEMMASLAMDDKPIPVVILRLLIDGMGLRKGDEQKVQDAADTIWSVEKYAEPIRQAVERIISMLR